MTVEEMKEEIARLEKSEDVKRGRKSEEMKLKNRLYVLRYYERKGKEIARGGKDETVCGEP